VAGRRRPDFIEAKTVCLRANVPTPRLPATPMSDELAPGTMVGEFRIEGKLGQGAMGVVYGAVHPVIGKRAAIKVMRPLLVEGQEAAERFLQEARAVGGLGHPNIVDAFGFGALSDGRCYYVMEWLQGQSLGTLVRQGRLSIDDTLVIVDQICRALDAAHSRGIIHRDLKPDNVFLQEMPEGRAVVKLLDFSIAKLVDEDPRQPLTRAGVVIGTPAYVSPEQVRGAPVDGRADIYALGILTFEMLAGRLPFSPAEKMALLHMHLHEAAPIVSSLRAEVPPALDALVARMLAKQPDARPSLREIRRVLSEVRAELVVASLKETPTVDPVDPVDPVEAVEPPTLPATRQGPGDRRRVVLAVLLGAAALTFSTLALSHEGKGPFVVGAPDLAGTTLAPQLAHLPSPPPSTREPARLPPPPQVLAAPVTLEGEQLEDPLPRQRHRHGKATGRKKHRRSGEL
jgi:eukaryotic-like serine/threonine-protein kinase